MAEYFWRELPKLLPVACAWVVYGCPVLVHAENGVIFGFAGGTHTYALRLPIETRQQALLAGATTARTYSNGNRFSLAEIGQEWVLGGWLKEEPKWCLAAFAHAGSLEQ